jgi:hypothetical protein
MSSAPGTANEVPADDRDESDTITACAVVLVFLASVAVFLRFYVRVKLLHSVKSEDWCMLASLVGGTPPPASHLRREFWSLELNVCPGLCTQRFRLPRTG